MVLRSLQLTALFVGLAVIQWARGVQGDLVTDHRIDDNDDDDDFVVPSYIPRGVCGQPHVAPKLDATGNRARPNSWPWMVSIRNASHPRMHVCAGVLVSMRHVLTTASCALSVSPRALGDELLVVMGLSGSSPRHDHVAKVHIHPEYAPYPLDHDMAVIELTQNITLCHDVGVICLPSKPRVHSNTGVFISWNKPPSPSSGEQLQQNNFTLQLKNPVCVGMDTCGAFVNIKHSYCGLVAETADPAAGCFGGIGGIGGPLQFRIKDRWYVYGLLEYFPTTRRGSNSRSNAPGFIQDNLDAECALDAPRYFSKVEVDIRWILVKLKNYPDY